ncbi:MAG: glycosyltransferase family 1 protein [bacterium]|nr:glycosyltransferase family 1 protein [bacterium]
MRVLIDLRCLQAPPPRGGVARYAEQAVRALLAVDRQRPTYETEPVEWILSANGAGSVRRNLPVFDHPRARWHIGRWPNKLRSAAYSMRLGACGWPKTDVVWLPNLAMVPRFDARTKLIVTVHDLSFEHFADCFTAKQRLWHRAVRPRQLLARANAIIAVSETTKRDVMEAYTIAEPSVHVVYPGIDHAAPNPDGPTSCASCCILPAGFPFMLALSECSPRKNLDGLIAAFEKIATDLHLVIAGKPGSATRALRRQIARSPARSRIDVIGEVTEHEKAALLARARCFVFPSFWEGFGFPALEAMAAGVPVVAAAAGALPEVLGDAAVYCDPLNPADIARAMERAITDDDLRTTLIARGRTTAQRYRWETTAERLHAIIRAA